MCWRQVFIASKSVSFLTSPRGAEICIGTYDYVVKQHDASLQTKKTMISIVCEEQKKNWEVSFMIFFIAKIFFVLSVRDTYFRLAHAWRFIYVLSNGCFELNIHCSLSMCAWHFTISFGLLFPRLVSCSKEVDIAIFFAASRIKEFWVNQVIWRWISVATTPRTHSFWFFSSLG